MLIEMLTEIEIITTTTIINFTFHSNMFPLLVHVAGHKNFAVAILCIIVMYILSTIVIVKVANET